MHRSVGAIIKSSGKILMLERRKFPFGWAGPAGHIEDSEAPEAALMREVKEETGLKVEKYKLLFHEFVSWNECSRGAKGHDWYLYEVTEWQGEIIQDKKEAKKMGWKSEDEIKSLKLEEVWKYWFGKLGIL